FNRDGDGMISAFELRAYFTSIGFGEYMSYEDAEAIIKELDTDGDDLLNFLDFLKLMKRDDEEEDLKKAFEMFELEKGDGCITPRGLQRMLNKLGDQKSLDECVAMIQVFDTDANGVLDFHEFHQMMV
ncbi:LOW QUALITY PROTEIN: probable calcium-binding protein CML41, partial [Jatropha curcas]|uniref:LOW QUALITY PROTEIN: probable calcium-binding protein CML41 n=1 Tax=Jatropha curcas TaxID=180498 RepID=UPI0018961757